MSNTDYPTMAPGYANYVNAAFRNQLVGLEDEVNKDKLKKEQTGEDIRSLLSLLFAGRNAKKQSLNRYWLQTDKQGRPLYEPKQGNGLFDQMKNAIWPTKSGTMQKADYSDNAVNKEPATTNAATAASLSSTMASNTAKFPHLFPGEPASSMDKITSAGKETSKLADIGAKTEFPQTYSAAKETINAGSEAGYGASSAASTAGQVASGVGGAYNIYDAFADPMNFQKTDLQRAGKTGAGIASLISAIAPNPFTPLAALFLGGMST